VWWLVFWSWRIAINWLVNLSPDLGYKIVGLFEGIFSFRHKVTLLRLQSIKMSASRRPGFVPKLCGGTLVTLLTFWKAHYLNDWSTFSIKIPVWEQEGENNAKSECEPRIPTQKGILRGYVNEQHDLTVVWYS